MASMESPGSPADCAHTAGALVYLPLGFYRQETKNWVSEMGQQVKAPATKPDDHRVEGALRFPQVALTQNK